MSEQEIILPELILEEQDLRLLKTILAEPAIASEFANTYDESIFMGDSKKFAKMVLSYIKAYKMPPTKRVMLDRCSSNVELLDQISTIWDSVQEVDCSVAEFKYDLDKIKNRFAQQKVTTLKNMLDDPPSDLATTLKVIQEQLDDVKRISKGRRQTYTQKTLKSYIPDFKQSYNDKFRNKEIGRGILTGYSYIDYIKNGMLPAEMMIVAGETGAGKSMVLNNMAIQMWMQQNTVFSDTFVKGYNVLYFSLEMPYEACARRTLARIADVPMYALRDSALSKFQVEGMKRATDFIEKYPYEFEIVDIPRGVTPEQVEARFVEAQARYNPDVVVVDYLGLLEDPEAQGDDWLKLGYIAGKLHELARVYNVVMLTAVQLNRPPSSKSKQNEEDLIGIHRIGRSSLIMHHANLGIQIQSRPAENTFSDLKYHIIKNRDGELGSHIMLKNFKNASVTDSPYEPKLEDGVPIFENDVQDISELLTKYSWDKT
jgi:replicative DNA helicase